MRAFSTARVPHDAASRTTCAHCASICVVRPRARPAAMLERARGSMRSILAASTRNSGVGCRRIVALHPLRAQRQARDPTAR